MNTAEDMSGRNWDEESGIRSIPPVVQQQASDVERAHERVDAWAPEEPSASHFVARVIREVCLPILRAPSIELTGALFASKRKLFLQLHGAWQLLAKEEGGVSVPFPVEQRLREHYASVLGSDSVMTIAHIFHASSVARSMSHELAATEVRPELRDQDYGLALRYYASQEALLLAITCMTCAISQLVTTEKLEFLATMATKAADRALDAVASASDLRDEDDEGEATEEDDSCSPTRYVLTPEGVETFRRLM